MHLELQNITSDDGTNLCYVDVGKGRPLVYVNGFGEDVSSSNRLLEILSKNFRCVSFDHRGYGKSDLSSEIGVEQSAKDLRFLMDKLDINDAALVGYSMGGSVVFSYVEQFGVERLERLVLADTSPKLINENGWNLGLWQGRYTRADYERDLKLIVENPTLFHLSFYARAATKTNVGDTVRFPSYEEENSWVSRVAGITRIRESLIRRIFKFNFTEDKKEGERRYWETMTNGDWRHVLGNISIPTLCLYAVPGSFYYSATAEYMAEQIPNAKTNAINDACHLCPKENVEDFGARIIDFCL